MHDCYPCPPFWGYPIASCLDHLFPLNTFSLWIISAFCMGCLYQYKQETQHFSYNFFLFSPYQDPLTQGCVCGCGCVCMCVLKTKKAYNTNSVQFSHSVMSDSLQPHELQHTRPPCSSPNPGVHSNSCLSSRWCHPAISSSVVPFSSCPQSLPASESFPMSQLLTWGGQSTGVSALASFLPKNTQGWSPLEWTGWISL